VPFLSLVVLRQSTSVNIATFHAYAGFSPAMELGSGRFMGATRPGSTAGSRSAPRPATSSTASSPATTRSSPTASTSAATSAPCPIARWQDGTPNILFVGRLEDRKGLPHLLKAFRLVRKGGAECRLLIVGSGPQEREARRYVMTRGLQNVEFLGRVSDAEKAQLFKTADIFVSPATGRESFGIVLLEAMAAGTPIVCSDIHGYKGVVQRGRQALLVPPHDAKALAAGISELLADPALRARMGAAGQERAEQFSWEHVTAKVEDYYGFVIRRLAAQGQLPPGFSAAIANRTAARRLEDDVARAVLAEPPQQDAGDGNRHEQLDDPELILLARPLAALEAPQDERQRRARAPIRTMRSAASAFRSGRRPWRCRRRCCRSSPRC
jgi:phosphatidylinositol alpha-mannosyltransferase